MKVYLLPLIFGLSGCSLQKMALRQSTPIFQKASEAMMKEGDWEFFRASAPGNIKFLELIWEQDQENLGLLSSVIKSYAGYAFGIHETLALDDELGTIEDSLAKKDAITYYTRALDYGVFYLDKRGIRREDLLSNDEDNLRQKFQNLSGEDKMALLYTAQSWGSLINLQKDNVSLVSQVSKVKLMFDRVCELDPDIDHNVCDVFYAQYDASRPKMLGGNPEKGEEHFLSAIKKHPKNLLIRVAYIQSVVIPQMDAGKYEKEASFLREEFVKLANLNRDSLENTSPYKDAQELGLYNAIAKKRFTIIEKYKSKIFE
jgi:hypothetical protein